MCSVDSQTLQARGSRGFWRSWVQSWFRNQHLQHLLRMETTYANAMSFFTAQSARQSWAINGDLLLWASLGDVTELVAWEMCQK